MGNLAHTPWKNVRTFLLVVRLGSFQKAAEALFITPSAVSQQIQQLEQFFKVRLLNRNAKNISLTNVGKRYYYQVNDTFKKIEENTEIMLNRNDDNVIRVGASVSFNMYFLIPNLFKFEEKYPDIKVIIHTGSKSVDQAMDFDISKTDIAIYHLKEDPEGLVFDKLFTNDIFPVCTPQIKSKLTDGNIWTLMKDQKIPLIGSYAGQGKYDWEYWFKETGTGNYSNYIARNFKYISHAHQAALSGLGICLARSAYVKEYLDSGQLVTLTPEKILSDYSLYLVAPAISYEKESCRIFRDWILDTFCVDYEGCLIKKWDNN